VRQRRRSCCSRRAAPVRGRREVFRRTLPAGARHSPCGGRDFLVRGQSVRRRATAARAIDSFDEACRPLIGSSRAAFAYTSVQDSITRRALPDDTRVSFRPGGLTRFRGVLADASATGVRRGSDAGVVQRMEFKQFSCWTRAPGAWVRSLADDVPPRRGGLSAGQPWPDDDERNRRRYLRDRARTR